LSRWLANAPEMIREHLKLAIEYKKFSRVESMRIVTKK